MSRSFKRTNERRIELLRKRHQEGLSAKESLELERVEEFVDQWIDKRHPLPTANLEELKRLVAEMLNHE